MGMAHVLYAEDDRSIRESVTTALELEGHTVTAVADGQSALTWLESGRADLVVLDVMMPFMDGLTACRRIRAQGDRTPVLMLTARAETSDRVSGLDAGADAYLPKPFDVDDFLAHVRALLRRATFDRAETAEIQVDDLRIDESARRAWRGTRELELTKTEFDLLTILARNTGIVLSHSSIYEDVWQYDFGPESKTLAVYISYLRRKLEFPGESPLLHTVRGVGYTLRPA
jgi:two-component system, OmpR family, response regulator MprA